jgi:hypothetical protein
MSQKDLSTWVQLSAVTELSIGENGISAEMFACAGWNTCPWRSMLR